MIIQLFIFGLIFFILALITFIKKKKILGWLFILLGVFSVVIGAVAVYLYPHIWPF